ncbi:MAG: SRPBCC family protein [Thermoplasmata archaeon]|nr:SRPBCC family protein [Thermoplasmata archaeon]
MLKAEARTTVAFRVEEVWKLFSDGDHLERWFVLEAGETIRKSSDGPMKLGATLRMKGRFMGKDMDFDARVSEFEPNRKIAVEYVSGPFRGSRKSYQLEPDPAGKGTTITHPSEGEFHGSWKLMAFLFHSKAQTGLQKSAEDELTKIAGSLSATVPRSST